MLSLTPLPAMLSGYFEANRLTHELNQRNDVKNKLSTKLDGLQSKGDTLAFLQYFNNRIYDRNAKYQKYGDKCWSTQQLVNLLQHSLNHEEVADTWFDEFKIIPPNDFNGGVPVNKKVSGSVLVLSGRYLVRPTVNPKTASQAALEENLTQLNEKKQRALTSYLSSLSTKSDASPNFKKKGKGDLYNKYYVYFDLEIELDK